MPPDVPCNTCADGRKTTLNEIIKGAGTTSKRFSPLLVPQRGTPAGIHHRSAGADSHHIALTSQVLYVLFSRCNLLAFLASCAMPHSAGLQSGRQWCGSSLGRSRMYASRLASFLSVFEPLDALQ